MPEGDIGNWLDLLDVPLMELHDYDISTGEGGGFKKAMVKLFKRRGDRRVVEFFNQNKAFIRETKGLVEDFQGKFDDTLKREEARISEALGREFKFPPKLFAIASGSNMGTQLTDDQSNIVQGEYLNAVKRAETLTGSEKKDALAVAEKSKSNSILAMREDNRKQQIARRDNALEALLRQSPDLFNDQLSPIVSDIAGSVVRMPNFGQPLLRQLDRTVMMTIVLMRMRMGQLARHSLVLVAMIQALAMNVHMFM